MAHILEFRCNAERGELDCEPMLQRSAQIIIFPGVRYMRLQEDEDIFAVATAPLKSPSKGKK